MHKNDKRLGLGLESIMRLLAIGKKSCFKAADINGAEAGITGRSEANASAGEASIDSKERNSEMHSNVLTKYVL
jgi:hypothetical protein